MIYQSGLNKKKSVVSDLLAKDFQFIRIGNRRVGT